MMKVSCNLQHIIFATKLTIDQLDKICRDFHVQYEPIINLRREKVIELLKTTKYNYAKIAEMCSCNILFVTYTVRTRHITRPRIEIIDEEKVVHLLKTTRNSYDKIAVLCNCVRHRVKMLALQHCPDRPNTGYLANNEEVINLLKTTQYSYNEIAERCNCSIYAVTCVAKTLKTDNYYD